MVVVLIIAILIAIAIPQFLGARSRAQDAAAKSDLRNALTAEKTSYTDNAAVHGRRRATLAGDRAVAEVERRRRSAGRLSVTCVAGDSNVVCLQETSKSGTMFSIADVAHAVPNAGTYYTKGTCSTDGRTPSGTAWGTGW